MRDVGAAPGSGRSPSADGVLTSGQVARLFGVDPKTVSRWAVAGRLDSTLTAGGRRRFREADVRDLLDRCVTAAVR